MQALKLKLKPIYEVESERFYSEFLNKEDAQNLKSFVADFTNRLSISSAILAVGSSVFPDTFWDYQKKVNINNFDLNASEIYNDIDLLVVPKMISKLNALEKSVQDALSSLGFQWESHETTTSGVSYLNGYSISEDGESKKIICPFVNFDYGLHSISTHLKNGTKLDLILGRDDLLEKTATQKIAEERKGKYAFSLLYKK